MATCKQHGPYSCPHCHPEQAAKAMGSVKSERKAQAARENGKKGGRPKKSTA